MRVIISGGGTGGHIFPAVAIAKTIQQQYPKAEILFVGALGKMEMEKVPAAGFEIVGLPIVGIQRRLTWKNLLVPFKLLASMLKARRIIREFKPDIAIGVGGYASGPLLRAATSAGIATLIQEQNSFPGITNRILSKKVNTICVAYPGLEKYFPKEKLVMTGNPVRPEVVDLKGKTERAQSFFKLNGERKTILNRLLKPGRSKGYKSFGKRAKVISSRRKLPFTDCHMFRHTSLFARWIWLMLQPIWWFRVQVL
jgi:UDP-N-acetylglucosamine--N-acetylmuramyl-(pentapeptide) pyrophosphoryl-undecaprenol N-acetylglucosamine transferase